VILARAVTLPDADERFRADWGRWQVEQVRRLACEAAGEPLWLQIAGCIEECSDEFPTAPEEHDQFDSIGVFYDDGDGEEAAAWAELCAETVEMLNDAVTWEGIRPSVVVEQAARNGIVLRPAYCLRAKEAGLAMNRQEIDAIETSKSDRCDVELGRRPDGLEEMAGDAWDHFILSYTEFVAGPAPPGVERVLLWRPSVRWRSARTDEPAKVVLGWGLRVSAGYEDKATEYAAAWRFAFEALQRSVNWKALEQGALRERAVELGLVEAD